VKKITKIVLTGGPCAGKTTGLCYLEEKLANQGFSVFKTPEIATLLDYCGIKLGKLAKDNPRQYIKAQELLLKTLIQTEDYLEGYLQDLPEDKIVLFCDRGTMDQMGYFLVKRFNALLAKLNLDPVQARDARYDAVVHLVTAAKGAEDYYSLENNSARCETPEEARLLDERIKEVWLGHPHLEIIDNSTDFQGKMKRLRQAVARVLGIPVPLEIERKFLLDSCFSIKDILVPYQKISIEQCYLMPGKAREARIRKRGQRGSFVYYLAYKQPLDKPGIRIETEERIAAEEYDALRRLRDREKRIIRKNRFCFIWQNQYFELDVFKNLLDRALLEIELTEENQEVSLPPFLPIVKEVTGDSRFSNYHIASKNP